MLVVELIVGIGIKNDVDFWRLFSGFRCCLWFACDNNSAECDEEDGVFFSWHYMGALFLLFRHRKLKAHPDRQRVAVNVDVMMVEQAGYIV